MTLRYIRRSDHCLAQWSSDKLLPVVKGNKSTDQLLGNVLLKHWVLNGIFPPNLSFQLSEKLGENVVKEKIVRVIGDGSL